MLTPAVRQEHCINCSATVYRVRTVPGLTLFLDTRPTPAGSYYFPHDGYYVNEDICGSHMGDKYQRHRCIVRCFRRAPFYVRRGLLT